MNDLTPQLFPWLHADAATWAAVREAFGDWLHHFEHMPASRVQAWYLEGTTGCTSFVVRRGGLCATSSVWMEIVCCMPVRAQRLTHAIACLRLFSSRRKSQTTTTSRTR